jgi:hypothetical protein
MGCSLKVQATIIITNESTDTEKIITVGKSKAQRLKYLQLMIKRLAWVKTR